VHNHVGHDHPWVYDPHGVVVNGGEADIEDDRGRLRD